MFRNSFTGKLVSSEIVANDGGTYQVRNVDADIDIADSVHTEGFMVSLPGTEAIVLLDNFDSLSVSEYVLEHLATLLQHGMFFGAWINDGVVYPDISEHFYHLATAIEAEVQRSQLAIWDCGNGEAITL